MLPFELSTANVQGVIKRQTGYANKNQSVQNVCKGRSLNKPGSVQSIVTVCENSGQKKLWGSNGNEGDRGRHWVGLVGTSWASLGCHSN